MFGFVLFMLFCLITNSFAWKDTWFASVVDHIAAEPNFPTILASNAINSGSVNMIAAPRGYALRAFGYLGELRVTILFDTGSCRDVINAEFSDLAGREPRANSAFISETQLIPENVEGFARGISIEINRMISWSLTFRENEATEASERIDFQAVPGASQSVILGMPTLDRLGMD